METADGITARRTKKVAGDRLDLSLGNRTAELAYRGTSSQVDILAKKGELQNGASWGRASILPWLWF